MDYKKIASISFMPQEVLLGIFLAFFWIQAVPRGTLRSGAV